MQPLLFSEKEAVNRGQPHWVRVGTDVLYFKNRFAAGEGSTERDEDSDLATNDGTSNTFMTASFSIEFPHENDVCYLAYHFPYTYSKLLVCEKPLDNPIRSPR